MSANSSRLTMSEPRAWPAWNRTSQPDDNRSATSSTHTGTRPNNWSIDWSPSGNVTTPRRELKKANQERQQENEGQDIDIGSSPLWNPRMRPPATFPRLAAPHMMRSQRNDMDNIRLRLNLGHTEQPDSNQIVGRLMQIRDYIKQTQVMMQCTQDTPNLDHRDSYAKLESLVENLKEQEKGYLNLLQKVLASREETMNLAPKPLTPSDVPSEIDVQSTITTETQEDEMDEDEVTSEPRPRIEDHLGQQSDDDGRQRMHIHHLLDSNLATQTTDVDFPDVASQRERLETDLATKNNELQSLREQHILLKEMLTQQEQLRSLQDHQAALMALQKQVEEELTDGKLDSIQEPSSFEKTRSQSEASKLPDTSVSRHPAVTQHAAVPHQAAVLHQAGLPPHLAGFTQMPGMTQLADVLQHSDMTRNAIMASQSSIQQEADQQLLNAQTDVMSQQLDDLRLRLQQMENVYDDQLLDGGSEKESTCAESEHSGLSSEHQKLQNKLQNLQEKKQHMDKLLYELQTLRDDKFMSQAEDDETAGQLGTAGRMGAAVQMDAAVQMGAAGRIDTAVSADLPTEAREAADDVDNLLQILEVRKKLKKLEDVKERLSQLKELVQYYQANTKFIHNQGTGEMTNHPVMIDHNTSTAADSFQDGFSNPQQSQNLESMAESTSQRLPAGRDPQADVLSDISSDFGAWGDDPDIKEKVRRLKDAREKLHRLQSLIAMVQHSPEKLQCLPDDLALLAASLEGGQLEHSLPEDSTSRSRQPCHDEDVDRSAHPAAHVVTDDRSAAAGVELRYELEKLMEERRKILSIQQDLQRLHEGIPTAGPIDSAPYESSTTEDHENIGHQGQGRRDEHQQDRSSKSVPETAQVTFGEPLETVITNEELYGQMRQQRILREELREKKRELEQYMKKDRPKRHYFRNQDNQSDNVSYSNKSDQFGASASEDVTMATWGGSTAGNLESIEEDGSGKARVDADECDDGYPSDGIVQVEEEEEANDESDDRDTYTIENEYGPRPDRGLQTPAIDTKAVRGIRRKPGRGAPFQGPRTEPYNYNHWASHNNHMMNNGKRSPSYKPSKSTQRPRRSLKHESHMEEEMEYLKEQVQILKSLYLGNPEMGNTRSHLPHVGQGLSGAGVCTYSPSQWYPDQLQTTLHAMSERINLLECGASAREQVFSHSCGWSPGSGQSTGQPAQGYGMPGQSNGQPAQEYSRPGQSTGQPAQGYSRPGQSTGQPAQEYSRPGQPTGQPAQGYSRPGQSTGQPAHDYSRPGQSNGQPAHDYSRPGQYTMHSRQEYSRPEQSTAQSGQEHGSPGQFCSHPQFPITFAPGTQSGGNRSWIQHQVVDPATSPVTNTHAHTKMNGFMSESVIMQHSPDTIPIDTVHAANEQAIRDHGAVIQSLHRSKPNPPKRRENGNIADTQQSKPTFDRNQDDVVIARRFSTPMRVSTAGRLADQQLCEEVVPQHTTNNATRRSTTYSATYQVSPSTGCKPAKENSTSLANESDAQNLHSFEALRETIYAEVATLISRNEGRPHFLIELFRELQHLDSDYLRQRAIYAIQDLVFKHLTEDDVQTPRTRSFQPGAKWSEGQILPAAEELTPSESVLSTEDDQEQEDTGDCKGPESIHSDNFDYAENVETTSSLSTPSSNNNYLENPFAGDTLGDTVIHLDTALRQMRDYELKLLDCETTEGEMEMVTVTTEAVPTLQEQQSDGSVSDVPYPRIDTSKLDVQIKGIMDEIVPVMKEHINDVCTQQLLQYIKRLVLLLTKQQDSQHDHAKFFQGQLGSIVQESLAQFEGRKLRDCGEDLLVDLSEILFNELAFFRLMQDLDDPKAKVKASFQQWTGNAECSTEENKEAVIDQEHATDSSSTCSGEDDNDDDDDDGSDEGDNEGDDDGESDGSRDNDAHMKTEAEGDVSDRLVSADEEETLGKARDDEFAGQCNINECENNSDSIIMSPMKIELAPSETKPYTRIGSDEDDDGEDETANNEEPSDTAVARDAQNSSDDDKDSTKDSDSSVNEHSSSVSDKSGSTSAIPVTVQDTENVKADQVVSGAECDDVTIDDLPTKITGLSQTELADQIAVEQSTSNACDAVSDVLPVNGDELAGDPLAIKPPDPSNGSA